MKEKGRAERHTGRRVSAGTKLLLLGIPIVLLAAAYFSGVFERLRDPEQLRTLVVELGIWGPLLYLAAFSIFEAFGAPGALFILAASVVWPLWLALPLSCAGGVGAGVVGFMFARTLGRDWVQQRLPERYRRYDERLAERGLQTVILVRLVFFLAPPAHWVLGLSRVRFTPFLIGSALGLFPGIALLSVVGKEGFEWLSAQPRAVWIGVAVALLAIAIVHRWRSHRASDPA